MWRYQARWRGCTDRCNSRTPILHCGGATLSRFCQAPAPIAEHLANQSGNGSGAHEAPRMRCRTAGANVTIHLRLPQKPHEP
jgi:hypothetical protein